MKFVRDESRVQRRNCRGRSVYLAVAAWAIAASAFRVHAQAEIDVLTGPPALGADDGTVAAPPVGTRHYLASSFECFVDNCNYDDAVLRYSVTNGLFEGVHVSGVPGAYGLALHPLRGTLLVASRLEDKVVEVDAKTGALIRTFVKTGSGGLNSPQHILFRPNGNLLVTSFYSIEDRTKVNGVNEYNGKDGTFIGTFINGGSIEPELPEDCGQERCLRGPNGMVANYYYICSGGTRNGQNCTVNADCPGTGASCVQPSLYVVSDVNRLVIEYNLLTGAYKGVFQSDHLINPAFITVRPPTAVRPFNLAVTSWYPDADVNDTVVEFNFTSRQRVSFTPNSRDFMTAVANPGPMLWHTDGSLLFGDRTINTLPPRFADRILWRKAADGLPNSPANFTPSNDDKLHTTTALMRVAFGWASADEDNDNDTDLRDLAGFQRCFGRTPTTACKTVFDDDETGTVGWADFAALRRRFAGPLLPCTGAAQCDDANLCTTDTCNAGTCVNTPRPNNTACPDSLFCNGAEVCREGLCIGQQPCTSAGHCNESNDTCSECLAASECDDDNPCTNDTCSASGTCVHGNNTLPCNDGNACTMNDRCSTGRCVGGPPPNCNDNNLCTNDSCDPVIGCRHIHNTLTCNDSNACTIGDRCLLGTCRGGPPPNCDDDNPCTTDVCEPATQCRHIPDNGRLCTDDDACTENDVCANSVCVGDEIDCDDGVACTMDSCSNGQCVHTPNNSMCNDFLFCTGAETCHPTLNCVSGGNPCPQGQTCDENEDRCGECTTNAQCNDGIACTTDTCNTTTRTCTRVPNNAACNDGLPCNGVETCSATQGCQPGTPVNCNDNNACTNDSCTAGTGACVNAPNYNTATLCCNPANGQTTALSDGNECTQDVCNPATGVVTHPPTGAGTACGSSANTDCDNPDTCNGSGTCVGNFEPGGTACGSPTSNDCNGADTCNGTGTCQTNLAASGAPCGNPASTPCDGADTCNGAGTCQPNVLPNNTACDDSLFCTVGTLCTNGVCGGGGARDCADAVACTVDACNETTDACDHTPNHGACGNGLFCDGAEVCNTASGCQDGPDPVCNDNIACTIDSCDAINNQCRFTPQNATCQDNNPCTDNVCTVGVGCTFPNDNNNNCADSNQCNGTETCQNGTCVPGTAPDCDDDNLCTTDSCVPATGCSNVNNTNTCDDGDVCTISDRCGGGDCNGTPRDCSSLDVPPCLEGVCNPSSGQCEQDPVNEGGSCNDGDLCTLTDVCTDGDCAGTPRNCSSLDDACNDGVCNPANGQCVADPINEGGECNDGDPCTLFDICVDGECAGDERDCSAFNGPCSVGVCNATTGQCQASPINEGNACTDDLYCTFADTCVSGQCVGLTRNCSNSESCCNDNDPCTTDTCNEGTDSCDYDPATGGTCDDGLLCTDDDTCVGGSCTGTPAVCEDGLTCNPLTGDCE